MSGGGPRLLREAREGRAGFFLLFGGQGTGWFRELAEYWKKPSLRSVVERGLRAIEEELEHVDRTVAFPKGFEPARWLEDERSIPSEDYLSVSPVSVPMIFLTQVACLWNLSEQGFALDELLRHTRGISGHSQGLFTSSLFGLGRTGAEWDEAFSQFTKYVFYLGARSQETFPFQEPTDEERERTDLVSDRLQAPSPMVAVLGGAHREVEQRVAAFNRRLPADRKIQVSLYNAPTNRILCSHRSSLVAFHEAHQEWLEESKLKYIYIRTSCPYHSSHLLPIRPRVEADIARIGFGYPGSELRVPVYSFFDARNLQDDEEIAIKMYLDILINPLHYDKIMAPIVSDPEITHVIDLGPGNESSRLNRLVLEGLGCKKPVMSASVPAELAALLD